MEEKILKSNRFYELDIARAISILLLPMIHTFEQFCDNGMLLESSVLFGNKTIMLANEYAPSVFLFLLGMNLVFAKPLTAKEHFKRGIHFLILFLAINFFRYSFFMIVLGILSGEQQFIYKGIIWFVGSDIYGFIGLFLIVYALFTKLKLKPYHMLAISIITMIIANIISTDFPISTNGAIYEFVIGNFIYLNANTAFPLFLWLIFPIVGVMYGQFYQKISEDENKKTLYSIWFVIISYLAYFAFKIFTHKYDIHIVNLYDVALNAYDLDIMAAFLLICSAIFFICLIYILYKYVRIEVVHNFLLKISKYIMPFYAIQWIIIGNICVFAKYILKIQNVTIMQLIILIIFDTLASIILSFVFGDKINDLMKYKATIVRDKA